MKGVHGGLKARLYSGAGNRFVLVDAVGGPMPDDPAALAIELGARADLAVDGLLLLTAPRAGGDARMVVYNRDGTRPAACGNGLRCLAWHALDHGHVRGPAFVVETDSGPRAVRARAGEMRTALGPARVVATPVLETELGSVEVVHVDVGTPHAVVLRAPEGASVRVLGPLLGQHAYFPDGANVEIATVRGGGEATGSTAGAAARPRSDAGVAASGTTPTPGPGDGQADARRSPIEVDARVWERGVGETAACGTGAVAVAAAVCARYGGAPPVRVAMLGGTLVVSGALNECAWLAGPVEALGEVRAD